jgi:hypothetical protein
MSRLAYLTRWLSVNQFLLAPNRGFLAARHYFGITVESNLLRV